jgi:transcription antitermination protein NusB
VKPIGKRRAGREFAVQCLFQLDHNSTPLDEALPRILEFKKDDGSRVAPTGKARAFAEELIRGVLASQTEIDQRIKSAAENFQLERIGGVERAILRLAIYELTRSLDVPPVVIINEALEIAKRFAAEDAPKFVNGVLDRIHHSLQRPSRTPAGPPSKTQSAEATPDNAQTQSGSRA